MLDKLKSAFFYEDEEAPVAPAATEKLPPLQFNRPTGPATSAHVNYSSPSAESNAGSMKDQIAAELEKATTGSAYGQFKKMSNSLKARIVDSAQRVVATGATLEIQGVKSTDISIAARQATAFLDSEANSFETDAVNDLQNADTQLVLKQDEIAAAITSKDAQIKALQQEIADLQKEKLEVESTTIKTKGEIEVARAQFKSAMSQVKAEVEQDIKDIALHLGGI